MVNEFKSVIGDLYAVHTPAFVRRWDNPVSDDFKSLLVISHSENIRVATERVETHAI